MTYNATFFPQPATENYPYNPTTFLAMLIAGLVFMGCASLFFACFNVSCPRSNNNHSPRPRV